jgi:hypothetical protein
LSRRSCSPSRKRGRGDLERLKDRELQIGIGRLAVAQVSRREAVLLPSSGLRRDSAAVAGEEGRGPGLDYSAEVTKILARSGLESCGCHCNRGTSDG